jgi:RNA polymerase sigma-70 factor (ECF subfamily)
MDSLVPGHTPVMNAASASLRAEPAPAARHVDAGPGAPFDAVYEECLDFVWRTLKSLGIRDHALEDAIQDVFLVVHRKLADFEARSTVRTWVYGIAVRVARDHRRRERRKGGLQPLDFEPVDRAPGPHEHAAKWEALHELAAVLEALDEGKREVFVLAEVQQLTAPEIAEILGINLNTAYSRIRVARQEFKSAFEQHQGGRR